VRNTRAEAKGKVRFFAVGIGDAVSHRLVEGIGRQRGGFAEVVAVDATRKWESEVIRMLKGALTPSQWQCEITLPETVTPTHPSIFDVFLPTQIPIPRPNVIQAPYHIPSLHAFTRTSVYFFLNPQLLIGQSTIVIHGVAASGENFKTDIPLEEVGSLHPSVHFLAAKALMSDLESGQSWMHADKHQGYKSRDPHAFEKLYNKKRSRLA
jgi:hypothetical protein